MRSFVYLLDPETAIFRDAELRDQNSISSIADLIGSDVVQVIRFDEMHSLFVEEEALRAGFTAFTIFDGHATPLAGKIALLGGDGRQPYRSPSITMVEAARRFQCCRPVLDPVFAPVDRMAPKGLILAGALESLQVRIDRRTPLLLGDGAHSEYEDRGE
ncbi:PsiB protein (plasmid) [Rhizobium etli]|uniref:PsiB protein n=1 Tax=Rhizobium etli TaxID=29449 RepID=A0AAN1BM18_RHIET|nr:MULTISPECIES: protein psiB [Rhizobium]ARO32476.1 PsiB protein [Rhizobium sp. NXC14]ARQ13461.1 PsiB protein [Rhizobium etli]